MTDVNRSVAATLSPEEKRALLKKLLQERAKGETRTFPLSHGQRALWYLYTLAPESAAYNVAFAVRIHSPYDVEALQRACRSLAARHATLRTTYALLADEPVQEIAAQPNLTVEWVDASGCDEAALREWVQSSYQRPFDLARGPVMRAAVFTRTPTDHVLLVAIHHIAIDGLSLGLLAGELHTLYVAETGGAAATLPPMTLAYTDFVAWQQAMLGGPEGERLRDYWLRQLGGELPVLNLPLDHPRPPLQTFRGASLDFALSDELARALRALAKAENTTPYVLLLAAFYTLLHRHTGQTDLLIGSPMAGRTRSEFERLAGYFVNPVVLRADLSGDPAFRAFLGQVRGRVLEALAHQDYPFPLLVETLRAPHSGESERATVVPTRSAATTVARSPAQTEFAPAPRDPSRSPLFDVMFNLQKGERLTAAADALFSTAGRAPRSGEREALTLDEVQRRASPSGVPAGRASVEIDGLVLEPYIVQQEEGQFDLAIDLLETERLIIGAIKYNPDLFDAPTIERLRGHYLTLLAGIVANPEQRLSELPLLTEPERQQLLVEWNATQRAYDAEACLHELIAAQAARTPEAIAAVFQNQSLTYGELNRRANQLAHHLLGLGLAPEARVGVYLERSLEMLVAVLGVLKAGGAYVPLDPAFPRERLAYMLADAGVSIALTQAELRETLPAEVAHAVCLDSDQFTTSPSSNPNLSLAPDSLAYVIYTSGSTGKPKGVQIPHRALVNFLQSMQREPGLTERDVLLAVTTLSFDIAGLELYLPLIVGGRVVIAERSVVADGAQLAQLLDASGATVMQATPATWRLLLDSGWQGNDELKILCGGEALSAPLARALLDRCAELWNVYGPTETTIWSTAQRVRRGQPLTIGKPIANTETYILDSHQQPVPIGVTGELYIGGDGLARSYLNQPELTAQKFVPHPFRAGARLYRTGDLARHRPDGAIEFLGRADFQVKVRGYRIELGEIEAVLQQHPAVQQAVVIKREDVPGDQRLVAYLVPKDTLPDAADLRQHLRQQLPDYMLPSAFVSLAALPLTPNGKVDRRALPRPEASAAPEAGPASAPTTPMEQLLAEVWREALRVPHVGVYDNFFDLGGHSLLSVEVLNKLEQRTGLRVNPAYIRLHTLGQLAAMYDEQVARGASQPPEKSAGAGVGQKLLNVFRRIVPARNG